MSSWSESWSTWSSYTLADLLMFSSRTFYRLIESYNAEVWPGHLLAALAGLLMLVCALRPAATSSRLVAGLLAACWLWVAWIFFANHYAPINWAARYFAYGFGIEAILLLWYGGWQDRLRFAATREFPELAALGILAFALFAHPLLAIASGRSWRQAEMFGMTPDPTAIATLGMLLLANRAPPLLLLIPLLWCIVTGATLLTLHAAFAWVAPLIALMTVLLAAVKEMQHRRMRDAPR